MKEITPAPPSTVLGALEWDPIKEITPHLLLCSCLFCGVMQGKASSHVDCSLQVSAPRSTETSGETHHGWLRRD